RGMTRGELDPLSLEHRMGACDVDSNGGDAPDFVGGDDVARGKAPGPVHQDAHAKAEVLIARDVLDLPLARKDRFRSVAIDANVRIRGAEYLGPRQRSFS